jgi:tetratricopeptide (TPR) repeat protein
MSFAEDVNAGHRCWDQGDPAGAVDFYLRALRQNPRLLSPLKRIWWHAFAARDLGLFRDVLDLVPTPTDHPDIDILCARMARMLLRHDQSTSFSQRAERNLRASVEADHRNWGALKQLGNLLRDFGHLPQLEESLMVFSRALDAAPEGERPGILNDRGMTHRCLGDVSAAERDFLAAVDGREDFTEAHGNLAQALLLQGRYAEAWPEYEWRAAGTPNQRPNPDSWAGRHMLSSWT